MKTSTIVLLCATAIGAIAFNPAAASADFDVSIGRQGTSIHVGDSVQRTVYIDQRSPEWRYREEERLREEHRLAELRERERLAERRERERFAERRERERLAELKEREYREHEQRLAVLRSNHGYNSNNYYQNNASNNTHRDRYNH